MIDWGPFVDLTADQVLKGTVTLTESYDEKKFREYLDSGGFPNGADHDSNWFGYRYPGAGTFVEIGVSTDRSSNFAVDFDTTAVRNGPLEIMASMTLKNSHDQKFRRDKVMQVVVSN